MLMKILSRLLIVTFVILSIFFDQTTANSQEKSATITISTIPNEAGIFIDSKFIGISPIKGRPISVGKHHIRAELENYQRWEEEIEITFGENLIDIKLDPIKEDTTSVPPPPPKRKSWYKKTLVWVVASAAIIGTIIYLLIPKEERSKDLAGPPAPPPGI